MLRRIRRPSLTGFQRPAPLSAVVAAWRHFSLFGIATPWLLLACSDSGSGQTPVQEPPCTPKETQCAPDNPSATRVCQADGTWKVSACASSLVCHPATSKCGYACTPDKENCAATGTGSKHLCGSDGRWVAADCEDGQVCVNQNGQPECKKKACDVGQTKCAKEGGERLGCSSDATSWVQQACLSGEVCVTQGGNAVCKAKICTPGKNACSADHTSIEQCDATGTGFVVKACADKQSCDGGQCKDALTSLGDILIVWSTDPEPTLSPGIYGLAVLDTYQDADDEVPFPVSLTGSLGTVDEPPQKPPAQGSPLPSCGTARASSFVLPLATPPTGTTSSPPGPWHDVGETRTFHYPVHVNDETQTLPRTAKLRAEGTRVNLWEDQTETAEGALLSASEITDLVSRLDTGVFDRDEAIFGKLTDVDGNGKVDILFTDLLPNDANVAFVWPAITLFPPGTWGLDADFGEVIYSMAPGPKMSVPAAAAILAHETAHLIEDGTRLSPYLATGPSSLPNWIASDRYFGEGLAEIGRGWSGHGYEEHLAWLLGHTREISLNRLFHQSYHEDLTVSTACYGFGNLVLGYLFDQAGGIAITGPGTIQDNGGLAYLSQVIHEQAGLPRIAPLDGRPLEYWYADLATALLVSTVPDKVSAATKANKAYNFIPTTKDKYFNGFDGTTLRGEWATDQLEDGPLIHPVSWNKHPSTFRSGGLGFYSVAVGSGGAKLSITEPTTAAVLLRYKP